MFVVTTSDAERGAYLAQFLCFSAFILPFVISVNIVPPLPLFTLNLIVVNYTSVMQQPVSLGICAHTNWWQPTDLAPGIMHIFSRLSG